MESCFVTPHEDTPETIEEEVKEMESCFVTPHEDTPRQGLWLSPLDIVMVSRGHTPTVYFYQRDTATVAADFFEVGRLKEAMAKALVAFYPLAGRLSVDGDGRPEIDCNAEGALFVVAQSKLTVDAFSDLKPSPELRRLFAPVLSQHPSCLEYRSVYI